MPRFALSITQLTPKRTYHDPVGKHLAPGRGLTSPAAGAKFAAGQWFAGD